MAALPEHLSNHVPRAETGIPAPPGASARLANGSMIPWPQSATVRTVRIGYLISEFADSGEFYTPLGAVQFVVGIDEVSPVTPIAAG